MILIFDGNELNFGSHRFLLVITISFVFIICYLLIKFIGSNAFFNGLSIFISIFFLIQIVTILFFISKQDQIKETTKKFRTTNEYPDIYYFILDSYASKYTLENEFKFDNSQFYHFLDSNNFFSPKDSRSNYAFTRFSLPSSLNLNYLDSLNCKENTDLYQLISHSYVSEYLKGKGYTYIYFNTGYGFRTAGNNELAISQNSILENTSDNSFLNLYLETTLLTLIYNKVSFIENDYFRKKIEYAFSKVIQLNSIKSSKFVFMHLISPHPPYLFKKDGSVQNNYVADTDTTNLKLNYLEQLQYVNSKIQGVINNLIDSSSRQPIIILQSDHGITFDQQLTKNNVLGIKNRFYNFNSIYGPERIRRKFYDGISSVNTFRIIFNELFNDDFKILEDKSFLVSDMPPFQFTEITNKLRNE